MAKLSGEMSPQQNVQKIKYAEKNLRPPEGPAGA
jgi:hypothetical protein